MTDSQPTSGTQKIGFCHIMALKFNFKVTWTPQTIMIEEKPNSERFTQSVVFGVCGVCALFLTSIPHMWKIPHIFLTLKFIAKNDLLYFPHSLMWGKDFLTFPQPIFNFLTFWMCGIGCNEFPHTFPHTRPSRKIKRKIPYIFPMCGTLFSLHQFHTCGKFLTFSSLFPHFFLTLKFHSVSFLPFCVQFPNAELWQIYLLRWPDNQPVMQHIADFHMDILIRFEVQWLRSAEKNEALPSSNLCLLQTLCVATTTGHTMITTEYMYQHLGYKIWTVKLYNKRTRHKSLVHRS